MLCIYNIIPKTVSHEKRKKTEYYKRTKLVSRGVDIFVVL